MVTGIDSGIAAIVITGGACACLAGGGIGASIGAWSTDSTGALLALVQEHRTAWRLANWLWVGGVPFVAIGIAGLGMRLGHPFAILGAALWLIAGTLGAVHFAAREATVAAANAYAHSGQVPVAWPLVQAWAGGAGVGFMVLAYVANLLVGVALVRAPGLGGAFGWVAIASTALLIPLIPSFIPAGAILPPLAFAGAAWKVATMP